VATGGRLDRATIQGDAQIIDADLHGGWERLLPIWEKKSLHRPVPLRAALPLFSSERSSSSRRAECSRSDGNAAERPGRHRRRRGGCLMQYAGARRWPG
jgi:hypothetical protein